MTGTGRKTPLTRRLLGRGAILIVGAIALYVVAPSLLTLLHAVPQLGDVAIYWFLVVIAFEALSFMSLWALLRIALRTSNLFVVAVSQLAGNAASRVLPGGPAAGGVVQGGVLVRSGFPPATVGAVLSATGLLTTGMLFALPVLVIPAMLAGLAVPQELELGLLLSLFLAALLVGVGASVLWSDAVAHRLAGFVGWVVIRVVPAVGRRSRVTVVRRLIRERDEIRRAFDGHWASGLMAAAGNRMFDLGALVASLLAVGGEANPLLVLLAYVASLALSFVPITPGGLGFVEAGLTSLLVVAGATAEQAVVATLLYRLASFWLPIPLGLVAWGGWRATLRATDSTA